MDTKREHRTHAEGSPRGNPYDLTYSPSGRLIGKSRSNSSVTLSASVDMAYGYCDENQPHAVRRIFDDESHQLFDLRWDEAGNLGQVSMSKPGEMFEAGRFLFWTEDCCGPRPCGANRMHTAVDDKHYSYYAYDYGGERRLKLVGVNSSVDVNAEYMTAVSTLNEPTLYPSAYMVLTNKGYTNVAKAESRASSLALPRRSSVTVRKHYYAGTERVAARLGGGGLDALYHAIGKDNTIQTKANLLFDQSLEQVNNRILYENDLDCIMHNDFAKEEFGHWIDGIPYQMQAGVELNHDQFRDMMNSMLSDFSQGDEPDVYFYHSDLCKSREQSQSGLSYAETQQSVRSKHLGSASWITDGTGNAIQHIQYCPFGEPFVNEHASFASYSERFTFTGKERDEETGYGYFSARYYDANLLTSWMSVDPMADKYLSLSPYNYCTWNPVKLVDPDGERIKLVYQGIDYYYDNKNNNFYAKDGTILIPKEDSFESRVLRDINQLNGTKKRIGNGHNGIMAKEIDMLVQSKHCVTICEGNMCKADDNNVENAFNGNGCDVTIYLINSDKHKLDNNGKDLETGSVISMGHEFVHARWSILGRRNKEHSYKDVVHHMEEIDAMRMENILRVYFTGDYTNQRTHYNGVEMPKDKIIQIDSQVNIPIFEYKDPINTI